jgi:hypothetical protein
MVVDRCGRLLAAVGLVFCIRALPDARADEGMWLFNNPPQRILREQHGFEAGDAWLVHLQRASVRFNCGGSGSFVSSQGLVLTNHHVGADALQKLSSPAKDYVKDGFYAPTRAAEIRCVDLELNVLQNIEDVTARINTAVPPGADAAAAMQARRAAMNTAEKESLDQTGLRSDVVTLYQGGAYHLYRFKKYTDVRLVFAPEQQIAFFGGDPDNFEYPRFDLDICLFRVYEDGQPAKVEHYLKWSDAGIQDGDLTFVSGHPGHTDRSNTVAHLEFLRDRVFPYSLNKLRRWEVLLKTYSDRSDENLRRAQDDLFGVQNSRKARLGGLAGLQDPAVLNVKREQEAALRRAVDANPTLKNASGSAWEDIAAAIKIWRDLLRDYDVLEGGAAFHSDLFRVARTLLRLADETAMPNADRLREYRESNLDSLRQQLFSEAPIYEDLEIVKLADSLGMLLELAGEHALVRRVLAGQSPQQRAAALVRGCTLRDVAVRQKLAAGGSQALAASADPMLELARLIDGPAREVRKRYEEQVEEPLRQAYAKIARARFGLYGTKVYPDATFTLRLAFGTVRGYEEFGQPIPPWTTFAGLYQRSADHGNRGPFALPPRWQERKERLDLSVPFNFVSTADIIGGNSGSPVVNRRGEFVGIIFDGNLPSLVWDFVYTDKIGRALAVDSRAIIEALRKVYDAQPLVDELGR